MFSRFIKPRWKHSNPEVRRSAIERIDDPKLLQTIANDDSDTSVRQAAIARVDDLRVLIDINIAPEVQDALNQRFVALLPAALNDASLLPLIDRHLATRGGASLQNEIARHSDDPKLREWLIPRITDTTLLEQLAANDSNARIRLLAAERIEGSDAIQRTLKALGRKDKRVARLLKQRLEVLAQHDARQHQIDQLISAIEQLGQAEHWQRDSTQLLSLKHRWEELGSDADDAQRQRFNSACQQAEAAIEANRQQALAIEPIIADKTSHCELIENFVTHLQQRHRVSPTEADDLQDTLDTLLNDWNDLPALPEHLEIPLANRFHQQLSEARKRVATLLENSRSGRELEQIISRAEKLLRRKGIPAADVQALRQQWEKHPLPKDPALAEEYQNHYARLLKQLDQRVEKQAAARDKGLAQITQMLERIQENLDHDRLGDSRELEQAIRQMLDQLYDVPRAKLEAIQQQLRDFTPRIRELDGWRHWGTDKAREALIEEAEKLVDTPQTPAERAKAVAELRKRWKALVEIDHGVNHRLWKRFDKACNAAWELCAEHRKQESEQRQQHLEARQTICTALEQLAADASADNPPWRELDKRFQSLRNEWQKAGPVNRNDWRKIQKRYRSALDAVNAAMAAERESNHAYRMALIEQLEALADSDDLEAAKATVREAQKAWHLSVSGKRSVEQAMWKRFKAAGDAVFAREKERINQANEQTRTLLQTKVDICEQLEQLADDPHNIDQQLNALKETWRDTEMPRGKDGAAIEQRYREALKSIDFAKERIQLEQQLQNIEQQCVSSTSSDDTTASEQLLQQLLELEILCELPSPPNFEEARMARKIALLSERLNEGNHDNRLQRAITLLEQTCSQLKNTPIDPESRHRLDQIKEAIASILTTQIAELQQS